MSSLLLLLLSTMLVNVFVLVNAPGARGNKDARGQLSEEIGVAAFAAIMLLGASIGGYALQNVVMVSLGLEYLRTLAFLGLLAALTPLARWAAHGTVPAVRVEDTRFIEVVTNNAAFLGVALFSALQIESWSGAFALGVSCGVAFAFALVTFASLRERVIGGNVPRIFRGTPISLITVGIMALALLGLSGLFKL